MELVELPLLSFIRIINIVTGRRYPIVWIRRNPITHIIGVGRQNPRQTPSRRQCCCMQITIFIEFTKIVLAHISPMGSNTKAPPPKRRPRDVNATRHKRHDPMAHTCINITLTNGDRPMLRRTHAFCAIEQIVTIRRRMSKLRRPFYTTTAII